MNIQIHDGFARSIGYVEGLGGPASNTTVWLALSQDVAEQVFLHATGRVKVLCVDIPRSAYADSLSEAVAFFKEGAHVV